MTTLVFDGSFNGWLTAVFEAFEYRYQDLTFLCQGELSPFLFGEVHRVVTDDLKAGRVLKGLKRKLTVDGVKQIYLAHLSGKTGAYDCMWHFVHYVFVSQENIERNVSHFAVRDLRNISRPVKHEAHRMKAFVRFKLTSDGLYYSIIEPESDVIPLISRHFEKRYADQRWLIYDARRKYGIYYDLHSVANVEILFDEKVTKGESTLLFLDEREEFFQNLWRKYFQSVNIPSRKNKTLQLRHLPKRYWKHLVEVLPQI